MNPNSKPAQKFLLLSSASWLALSLLVASGLAMGGFKPKEPAKSSSAVKSQPYRWKNVTIVAGGFITGIVYHPGEKGLSYCRTDIGGAYRWDAKANHWVPLLDWLTKPDWNLYGVESIGLDPSDPKKLYLAVGTYLNPGVSVGAILRSNDQGRTFERTNLPYRLGGNQDGRSIGERLAVDPNNGQILYFGSRTDGLWKSIDGAKTWAKVDSFPVQQSVDGIGLGVVVFDPTSGKPGQPRSTIYVTSSEKNASLYVSKDAGATWNLIPGEPTGLIPHQMKLGKDGNLFITYGDGPGPNGMNDGRVFRLGTGFGRWTDVSPIKPHLDGEGGFGFAGLSIDPNDPNDIVVTTLDRWSKGDDVFRTTDGGRTWKGLKDSSKLDWSLAPYMTWGNPQPRFGWWFGAVALDPFNPAHVSYGTGANIWETFEAGSTDTIHWKIGGVGIEETAVIDLLSPAVGPHLISGLGDIGGFTHTDLDTPPPGMTLNPMFGNTDSIDSAERSPAMIVRVGRGEAKQVNGGFSLDAGLTWKPFPTAAVPLRGSGTIAVSADGSSIVWAPSRSLPHYSMDQGIIWSISEGLPTGTGKDTEVIADRGTPGHFYAILNGKVYSSEDGGVHFAPVDATGFPSSHGKVRATPARPGELWVPSNQGLFFSTNGAKSFSKLDSVQQADCIGFGKAAPGSDYPAIFISGEVQGVFGAFRSDDHGATWVKITDPAHEYGTQDQITGDPRIYGRVYLGTNGRGVLYGDIQ